MAAAQILVGLTTLTNAEADPNFSRIGDTGGGGATSPGVNDEVYIQGSNSVTRLLRSNTGGTQVDLASESSTQTITTTDPRHFYVWIYNLANSSADTAANGGYRIYLAGNANENSYDMYYVGGSDELPGGGWKCYVASLRQSGADTAGTFGGEANLPSTVTHAGAQSTIKTGVTVSRFQNFAIDSMFIGVGLTVYNGDSGAPAGITSFTSANDNELNRYGVCEKTSSGASVQGTLGIGLDDASTTDTYYSDKDIVILNPNKNPNSPTNLNTLSDFTGISIQGGLTTAFFTNVFFNSVDLYDKGYFSCSEGTNEPATVEIDGCTFQNWGPTTLSGFTTATNTTWISCEGITLNSGKIDQCTVETGVGGTYVFAAGTPENISNTSFICPVGGGGHAFEVTQSGNYSFVGNQFTDANGDAWGFVETDNAAVHINGGATGIAVTFNITGGGDGDFTYKLTGAGSTVDFVSAVTVNITGLPVAPTGNATEIRMFEQGTTTEIAGIGTENHRTATYSFSLPTGTNFDVRLLNLDFVPAFVANLTASTDPTNIPVDLKIDRVYDDDTPPSGE